MTEVHLTEMNWDKTTKLYKIVKLTSCLRSNHIYFNIYYIFITILLHNVYHFITTYNTFRHVEI
jgi:hypothetical protein